MRYCAAEALGEIGSEAKESVPILIDMLGDEEWRLHSAAAEALGKIGYDEAAVPAFIKLLKDERDEDGEARCNAADYLGMLGPKANAAIPALTELLTNENREIRVVGALALWKISHDAKTIVPVLIELLKYEEVFFGNDKGATVRWTAAMALAEIGPEAKAAVPALSNLLKDKIKAVRDAAASAIKKIEKK